MADAATDTCPVEGCTRPPGHRGSCFDGATWWDPTEEDGR